MVDNPMAGTRLGDGSLVINTGQLLPPSRCKHEGQEGCRRVDTTSCLSCFYHPLKRSGRLEAEEFLKTSRGR